MLVSVVTFRASLLDLIWEKLSWDTGCPGRGVQNLIPDLPAGNLVTFPTGAVRNTGSGQPALWARGSDPGLSAAEPAWLFLLPAGRAALGLRGERGCGGSAAGALPQPGAR